MSQIIVLIEDSPDIQAMMAEGFLDYPDFQLIQAFDGMQGLEAIAAHDVACAVIDINMPTLNGYQVVQALRGDPETEHIPLVILTARAQEMDQLHGILVGADRYLIKPVTVAELLDHIQQAQRINASTRLAQLERLAKEGE